jgi:amino acid adenylation domain-containing protein
MTDELRSRFLELAVRQPAAEALLAPDRPSLRFADVPRVLDTARQALEAWGVRDGDLVATVLPDGADTAACLVALACCTTVVPLNPAFSDHEFERYLQRIKPRTLIVSAGDGAAVRRVAETLEIPIIDLVTDRTQPVGTFSLQIARYGPPSHLAWNSAEDIALILLTSGSTGRAKLVPIATRVLLNYAGAMRKYYELGPADRSVHVMPMFHGHGLKSSLTAPLILGAGVVCPGSFDVAVFFSCLETFHPTWYSAGFTMHRAILNGINPYRTQAKNARLRFIRSGSGRLEPSLMLGLEDAFDAPVLERYGMSETCTLTYNPPPPAVRKPGTVGIVGMNSVRIVGPDGTVCGPHQEGEIVARGPTVVDRYWNDPDATAATFVDGWFHTGDLGRFDEDGYLTITGRLSDLINRGGEKISPVEVEGELKKHPGVLETCVFPLPHPTLGQEVVAAVVPREAGSLDEPELLAHARSRLASFKVPRRVYLVDAIPRTPAGKVQRGQLPRLLNLLDTAQAYESAHHPQAPPRSPLEIALSSLWASVLGRATVASDENFFLLGGDSLNAVRLVSQVHEAFGVPFTLADVLDQASTVTGMARLIEKARARATADAAGHTAGSMGPAPRIPKRNQSVPCPMSFQQRRLWFIDRMYPGSTAYHINSAIRIAGHLNVDALARAINGVVARHEALRTTFDLVNGQPCQFVAPSLTIPMPVVDRRNLQPGEVEGEIRRLLTDEVVRPFNLKQGPLLRAVLVILADDEHALLLVQHHIVTDVWSRGIFHRELAVLYDAFERGEESPLRPLAIQYPDYAAWQHQTLAPSRLDTLLGYWRNRLAGAPQLVPLPTDYRRAGQHAFTGSRMDRSLPPNLAQGFFELARKERISPYFALLAIFNAFLSRLSGEEDLVVGVPAQGRDRAETLDVIGFFLNMLPVRTDLSGTPSFRELLGRVRKTTAADLAHQDLPFDRLVEDLHPDRRVGETPLFNTTCILLDRSTRVARPGWRQDLEDFDRGTAPFDLSLTLSETDDGHRFTFRFNSAIFERSTIARLMSQLERLAEGIIADPDRPFSEIPLLTPEDLHEITIGWNQTDRSFPGDSSLQMLFESRVDATPDAVAVSDGVQRLTYAELDVRANSVAHALLERGVGPNVVVGVCLERSVELVVATLGIVKAGGTYLPLDAKFPASRRQFMLADANAKMLLTTTSLIEEGAGPLPPAICLDTLRAGPPEPRPAATTTGSDLAYVIYTSGSTGQPKGVAVRQRGVSRLVINTNYLAFSPATVIGQVSNIAFDAATFELWGTLLNGGRLEILADDTVLHPERLSAAISERGITALFLTTALFNEIARAKPATWQGLDTLLVGGEAADPATFRLVLASKPPARLVNIYGPTETTTFAAFHEVTQVPANASSIPVGRPISNTRLYVLDANTRPVAVGCQGELHIGGPGVAQGYVGRPELTAERFIADPVSNRRGEVLYKTGDRARHRSDGSIEILGRLDRQVKLRGFRIEPGEIESALVRHPDVAAAVVAVEGEDSDRHLVAYLVHASEGTISPSELRVFLKSTLPDFMVPDAFVWLDKLPLTPSGKIDRAALGSKPQEKRPERVLPRTATEQIVAEIWARELNMTVGVEDDFFELGGHSLRAISLIAALETRFGVTLSPATLFRAPTVSALARAIDDRTAAQQSTPLVRVQAGGTSPPIFALPGGGGSVIAYAQLARDLGQGQPFYGLEHPGLEDARTPPERIELVAKEFMREVLSLRSDDPCVLIGACSGAIVAFELACLLEANGHRVARLIMLDPSTIGDYRSRRRVARRWRPLLIPRFVAKRLALYARDLRQLNGAARREYLIRKGRTFGKRLQQPDPFRENIRELNRLRVRTATMTALTNYVPRPYHGAVTLITGDRYRASVHPKNLAPWKQVCQGPLDFHHIAAATSGEMLRPPLLDELVRLLKPILADVKQSSGQPVATASV